MKKAIIITSLAIFGLLVLGQAGILDALVYFLLVGAIPGTNFSVPSSIMLLVIISSIWLLLFRFTAIEAFYSIATKRTERKTTERKKRMPKRRFGQI